MELTYRSLRVFMPSLAHIEKVLSNNDGGKIAFVASGAPVESVCRPK